MSDRSSGPISPDFRYEIVSEFVKGLSSGAIEIEFDTRKWAKESIEAQKDVAVMLTKDVNEYCDPKTTLERRNELEPKMFDYIQRMRLVGAFKQKPEMSKIEGDIQRLDERFEAMRQLMMQILLVLKEIAKKVDERGE